MQWDPDVSRTAVTLQMLCCAGLLYLQITYPLYAAKFNVQSHVQVVVTLTR